MIIKLKNADFSANNIGQVQVTTELNAYTKAAIIASGNENLTAEQKSALDNLFLAMGVDGSNTVMSKMHKVYLPIIAGDVSKAVINYATSSFNADVTLSSSDWELRSNGLVGKTNNPSIVLTETSPILASNFFSCLLRTEKMVSGVNDSSYNIILRGKTNTSLWLGLQQQSVSSNGMISLGQYGANWGGSRYKSDDEIITSCIVSRSDSWTQNVQGTWTYRETPIAITSDMSGETSQTMYVFGLNTENQTKPYAVSMIGEAISDIEAKAVCDAIDTLYATFV